MRRRPSAKAARVSTTRSHITPRPSLSRVIRILLDVYSIKSCLSILRGVAQEYGPTDWGWCSDIRTRDSRRTLRSARSGLPPPRGQQAPVLGARASGELVARRRQTVRTVLRWCCAGFWTEKSRRSPPRFPRRLRRLSVRAIQDSNLWPLAPKGAPGKSIESTSVQAFEKTGGEDPGQGFRGRVGRPWTLRHGTLM